LRSLLKAIAIPLKAALNATRFLRRNDTFEFILKILAKVSNIGKYQQENG
jgi:hypothetical protein